ncbi:type II toxin-antitoxin system VapC family toxin [Sphingomonas sp. NBWT7]|uniref:type II toxin-antitoxin system VapC family toxin n=1 Tax=Sphingomonas sp. NBWT7 TaxID=2596913 RepID=UPI001625AE00|nr:type II toxin-antitoxin system VapC family toxin [Sphingomonas sp. NBWT7]QNE31836.1 type II toxin-antitoxin system VapC family toxin [Sphingomonas sp. NBWT7]
MIVDTSAIMAIVLDEPEKASFLDAMFRADRTTMSAGSWLELEAVVTRRGTPALAQAVERLLEALEIEIVGLSYAQALLGRDAYRRYGRGTGHPAALNFGDCFAYALAKDTGRPLLFKADDFARTDVTPAA